MNFSLKLSTYEFHKEGYLKKQFLIFLSYSSKIKATKLKNDGFQIISKLFLILVYFKHLK